MELVARSGVAALTIDGLAKAAGVTKGGVQYHFHTKEALLKRLLEYLISEFEAEIEFEAGPDAGGRDWLATYVAVSLRPMGEGALATEGVAAALIAALAPDDPCAEPFRQATRRWRERAERGVSDPALAQLIRLAADSVWLDRMYGELDEAGLEALRNRLFDLIENLQ
jgi:AcrR family transcriptional regulator